MLRLSRIAFELLQTKGSITQCNQIRCLFSRRELGVEGFEKARRDAENFVTDPPNYKRNFQNEFVQKERDFVKFENALKHLLYLINNSEEDIKILKNALIALIRKQKEHTGYKYIFGPTVMRAFHYLDVPNVAIEFLEDKITGQLFTEITGYQVLMDLLYEHKMYGAILRIQENQTFKSKYIDAIVLATYYQINTPEAFEQAYDYWRKMTEHQIKLPFRKSLTYVAGLAVKHNKPEMALEVLQPIFKDFHVTVRQIKLLAWTQMGRFERIFDMFQTIIQRQKELNRNDEFTSFEVLNEIEKSLEQNSSDIKKFHGLRKKIESLGLVTKETLDDVLCAPFPIKLPSNKYHKR